jgi:hypothetical protein
VVVIAIALALITWMVWPLERFAFTGHTSSYQEIFRIGTAPPEHRWFLQPPLPRRGDPDPSYPSSISPVSPIPGYLGQDIKTRRSGPGRDHSVLVPE